MPELQQLKLNNSIINSLRDIGTSLRNLIILYGPFCKINDLSGITSFPQLRELYLSYNQIYDVSPLMYNESIEILDLEGNEIEKKECLEDLSTMIQLKYLNLLSNPIEKMEKYDEIIKKMLPKLILFNDQPLNSQAKIVQPKS